MSREWPLRSSETQAALWRDGSQRTEQSVAVFMPGGLDIVVFANSPIGVSGASLRNLVRDLYIANIVEP